MKKTLKLFAVVLLFAMTMTTVAPSYLQVKAASDVSKEITEENALRRLKEERAKLDEIDTSEFNVVMKLAVNQAKRGYDKLMENLPQSDGVERFNPETIYDLETIPARLMLLGKACQLIAYAAKVLNRKAPAAQNKVGGLVAMAIVKAVNPLDNDLERAIQEIDVAMEPGNLDAFPDITPEDSTTVYFVNDLDKILHAGRFLSTKTSQQEVIVKKWDFDAHDFMTLTFTGTKFKSREVREHLAKEIHEITLKRMLPQTTVEQTYKLFDQAANAMFEAMATPDVAEMDRTADIGLKTELYGVIMKADGALFRLFFKDRAAWGQLRDMVRQARKVHLDPNATVVEVMDTMHYLDDAITNGLRALD